MCGISGMIDISRKTISKTEIKTINDLISHRGPDDEGFYFNNNFAFGHRRLSVLDLSNEGHQPMHYLNKYVITYNGEIYNYLEIKEILQEKGYEFNSNTDTEVILAAYDQWGDDCVNHFNGMWAFAIHNIEEKTIFCSRDRFGIKPFYYTQINNKFIFASEIKQFTLIDGWKAILNNSRAFDFLEYGIFDHTDETLFEGVFQLKGGCNLVFDLITNEFCINNWYDLKSVEVKEESSFSEASSKFKILFDDAIKLILRSDVKVGSCLSGGLDSSSIVCTVSKLLKKSKKETIQETVSSCFNIAKYDEQEFIDEVTANTNTKSNKIFPQYNDLFKELENIVWHQDEPFCSTSIFAQWSVFKEAKSNNITVMLDGQGADEYLAGYHSFYGAYFLGLLKLFKINRFFREIKAYRYNHGITSYKIYKVLIGKIIDDSFKILLKKILLKKFLFNNKYKDKQHSENSGSIREHSLNQLLNINLPMLLHYEDRNSMAFSIESRVPFLDYRIVEFTLNQPDEYKIRNGVTKAILRNSMNSVLPKKILDRQDKMGFVTPEEIWIKENKEVFLSKIKEYIVLSNGLITNNTLSYFKRVINDEVVFDFTIWRIIVFGEWLKKFNIVVKS